MNCAQNIEKEKDKNANINNEIDLEEDSSDTEIVNLYKMAKQSLINHSNIILAIIGIFTNNQKYKKKKLNKGKGFWIKH